MNILVFKTDLTTPRHIRKAQPVFNQQADIRRWTVDTDDIDNVLRIEANSHVQEADIIHLAQSNGIYCEALPD